MSRITMELAEKIAKVLSKKQNERWKSKESEISTFIRDCYMKDIPEGVKTFFSAFPKWAETTSYIYVHATGNGRFGISVDYAPNVTGRSACITLNKTESDKLSKLRNEEEKFKKEWEQLKTDIYNALLQLRTFKNIEEKFPEAAKYFPVKSDSNLLPALNIDKIRKALAIIFFMVCTQLYAQQPQPHKYKVTLPEDQWNVFFSIISRLKENAGNPDLTTEKLKYLRSDADSIYAIFFNQVKVQYDSAHAELKGGGEGTIAKPDSATSKKQKK